MTQFTITAVDKNGNPQVGVLITAEWNQPLVGSQKAQATTDQNGQAQFNIGVNDATVTFTASKGLSAGIGTGFVGILGDTSTPNITITMSGSSISIGAGNFLSNLGNAIKADTTYLIIFGALGGGIAATAYIVSRR